MVDTQNSIDIQYMDHVLSTADDVSQSVQEDIAYQVQKYGAQRVDGFGWIAIISEEFGETVQAYLKKQYVESIAEAKQTIACLSRFITEIEREIEGLSEDESALYERAQ